ncbi:FidL-like putative membrane protein [Candidatus Pantoea varia]|uniref:FidL-like putative membrane protein n=1 Tax=Candidatus Pantoea varia TaxID=1881036 RepID=A0A1I5HVM3_9GAMM|nr:FidL-like putative membrane protein [Pantoea varia]
MLTLTLAALLLVIFAGINYFKPRPDDFPFRCSAFSRYDLSRHDDDKIKFAVSQDLRFIDSKQGYLLLNGQVNFGDKVTTLNRRVALSAGNKIDSDTYRYKIRTVITATNDTTPDAVFNILLAEITLDPGYLQLDVTQIDKKTYLVGGPLSYLFTCQRY